LTVTGLTSFQGGLGAIGEYDFHYNSYQAHDDLFWRSWHRKRAGKAICR